MKNNSNPILNFFQTPIQTFEALLIFIYLNYSLSNFTNQPVKFKLGPHFSEIASSRASSSNSFKAHFLHRVTNDKTFILTPLKDVDIGMPLALYSCLKRLVSHSSGQMK